MKYGPKVNIVFFSLHSMMKSLQNYNPVFPPLPVGKRIRRKSFYPRDPNEHQFEVRNFDVTPDLNQEKEKKLKKPKSKH